MQLHKPQKKYIFFLLLVVLTGVITWWLGNNVREETVYSENGIWDLSSIDFSNNCAKLSGNVEYVLNDHLMPDEFDSSENIMIGSVPDGVNYLTSRIRLKVPQDGVFKIAGFTADKASRIYINGELVCTAGQPAETREDSVAGEEFVNLTAKSQNGVIEIVQQTSNFVFRTNSSHADWKIGSEEIINRWASGYTYSYVISMGIYFVLFLVHLLLFIMMPSYSANLWFGLLCLIWALRTGITNTKPLTIIFSNATWETVFRVEYLTFVAAVVLLTQAYVTLLSGVFPKWLIFFAFGSQIIFTIMYMTLDTLTMSRSMIYYEIVALIIIVSALVCIIMKMKKPDMKHWILFAGLALAMIGLVLDSLFYNGLAPSFINGAVTEFVIMIFSMFQLTAMFMGTMQEVQAAKEAEQRLAVENAALERVTRLKTDILNTLSHEIRTPLAVMMGFAQLTAAELKDKGTNEEATANLDAISSEAKRLVQLVEDARNASVTRFGSEDAQSSHPDTVISQIGRMYSSIIERKGTRFILDIDENLPQVAVTTNELTQILFNLINNADKHTFDGQITISAKKIPAKNENSEETVEILVSDNGSGIPADFIPFAFDRYRTNDKGSTGLGLAICKEIIMERKGEISIESKWGEGTTVRFSLPVKEEDEIE